MEQAITQVTSGSLVSNYLHLWKLYLKATIAWLGRCLTRAVLQVFPDSVEETSRTISARCVRSPSRQLRHGGQESPTGRVISNYSNLQIADHRESDTSLSYPETPAGGDIQSFPWYYAGLATAVVRIAIKLSEVINNSGLTALTALIEQGQDADLINDIMEFNHGNGITGDNREQETMGSSSPYAILVAGNVRRVSAKLSDPVSCRKG